MYTAVSDWLQLQVQGAHEDTSTGFSVVTVAVTTCADSPIAQNTMSHTIHMAGYRWSGYMIHKYTVKPFVFVGN